MHISDPADGCSIIKSSPSDNQMIYLIKRGNCSFYSKSQFAQLAGAKMVIILDDVYEIEKNIAIQRDESVQSNGKLKIPTIMLDKNSSDLLLNFMSKNKSQVITVSFEFSLQVIN